MPAPRRRTAQAAPEADAERAVKLVDTDIHPAPLPSYIAERLDEPLPPR